MLQMVCEHACTYTNTSDALDSCVSIHMYTCNTFATTKLQSERRVCTYIDSIIEQTRFREVFLAIWTSLCERMLFKLLSSTRTLTYAMYIHIHMYICVHKATQLRTYICECTYVHTWPRTLYVHT
jgi:hypothetical protein